MIVAIVNFMLENLLFSLRYPNIIKSIEFQTKKVDNLTEKFSNYFVGYFDNKYVGKSNANTTSLRSFRVYLFIRFLSFVASTHSSICFPNFPTNLPKVVFRV